MQPLLQETLSPEVLDALYAAYLSAADTAQSFFAWLQSSTSNIVVEDFMI